MVSVKPVIERRKRKTRTTHNASHTRLYRIWKSMRLRCYYQSHKAFERYGGRGIVVCEEWKHSFEKFSAWAVASGYANNLTIDRINADGNYCPDNCRWLTLESNSARAVAPRVITINGETKRLCEWIKDPRCTAKESVIHVRLTRGWDEMRAIFTP